MLRWELSCCGQIASLATSFLWRNSSAFRHARSGFVRRLRGSMLGLRDRVRALTSMLVDLNRTGAAPTALRPAIQETGEIERGLGEISELAVHPSDIPVLAPAEKDAAREREEPMFEGASALLSAIEDHSALVAPGAVPGAVEREKGEEQEEEEEGQLAVMRERFIDLTNGLERLYEEVDDEEGRLAKTLEVTEMMEVSDCLQCRRRDVL